MMQWSPHLPWLAAAGSDGIIRIWDVAVDLTAAVLQGHSGRVGYIAWSPKRTPWRLASSSDDGTVRVWRDTAGIGPVVLRIGTGRAGPVSWSPDGAWLAIGIHPGLGCGSAVRLYDTTNWEVRRTLSTDCDELTSLAWRRDGGEIATAGSDGVTVWNPGTGAPRMALGGHAGPVRCVVWSPDGLRLATASADQTVRMWDADSGAGLWVVRGHDATLHTLAWGPDGKRLASADRSTVQIWDVSTGMPRRAMRARSVRSMAWSPDGRLIATGSDDGTILLWSADPPTGSGPSPHEATSAALPARAGEEGLPIMLQPRGP